MKTAIAFPAMTPQHHEQPGPRPIEIDLHQLEGIKRGGKRVLARHLRRHATPAERALWALLRRRALGVRFRRQGLVLGFIADFLCPTLMLVVEVDGAAHTAPDAKARARRAWDAARDAQLRRAGYDVLRLSNDAVLHDPDDALMLLRRVVAARTVAMARRHAT